MGKSTLIFAFKIQLTRSSKSLPPGRLAATELKEETGKIKDLVVPTLRRLTLLLWALWFINAIVYYGNVLFTPGMLEMTLRMEHT